ncbi:MAG: ATP-binding protein [Actinobacteria bacterium]|nr:ATP-binding protein [Actinomycetota bacterium]MCL6087511.1 ATP-binding protein [Actinomycetota bacterium]
MQNDSDIKKFLSELGLDNVLNIEQDLGNGYVKLRISEADRRQALQDIKSVEDIIVELLRNSRDAKAKNIFIATKKIEDKQRYIYFIDDGYGIPPKFHNLIFEARVTSKLENGAKDAYGFHGRGMALFSIKLNADDIKITFSEEELGTAFFIKIDLNKVSEKKDQSILPQVIKSNGNINLIGGVNNIAKILMEFSIQNPDVNIFFGTPSQIILSMRKEAKNSGIFDKLPKFNNWESFTDYLNTDKKIKINLFPCLTENYLILNQIVKKFFNMEISERTIQRIIYEEFKPVEPVNICSLVHLHLLEDKVKDTDLKNMYKTQEDFAENKKSENINDKNFKNNQNKNIILYDEQKLALRFKDAEISDIINDINEKIKKTGSKYLVEPDGNISFKKDNNTIIINIELKEV